MHKILYILLFFICSVFADYNTQIENFDKNFISLNSSEQLKLHQQLKNLYIQSIINDNEKNKIEVLKRLIISSKILNLDDSNYANELLESGFSEQKINNLRNAFVRDIYLPKTNENNKSIQKKLKDINKSDIKNSNKNIDKNIKEDNKTKNIEIPKIMDSNKTNITPKPIILENNKSKILDTNKTKIINKKEIENNTTTSIEKNATKSLKQDNLEKLAKISDKTFVLKSSQEKDNVRLVLNKKLSSKDFDSFALEEANNYRYISDFEGILEGGKKTYNFTDVKVVISQYTPKTIRIVVYSKNKKSVFLGIKDEIINVYFNKENLVKSEEKETEQENLQEDKNIKDDSLYVLDVDKLENGVRLQLSDTIKTKDITNFSMKDKDIFRKVFTFDGILEGSKKTYYFGKNYLTIAQFNPKKIRVVLSSPQEIDFEQKINDDEVILAFKTNKKRNIEPKKINFRYGKVVMIDAGHGGKDSGSIGVNNKKEKDIVLSVALRLEKELKKRGYKVMFTRKNDIFINLRDRTKMANDKKVDLFISIHANAAPNKTRAKKVEGIETFFLSPARSERSKKAAETENQGDFEEMDFFSKQTFLNFLNREKIVASNKLAIDVQKEVLSSIRKRFKIVDGGVREAPFWVLVGAQMPAILLEIGYITHPVEGKRINSKLFQEYLAKGIANGIDSYFYNNR